MTDEEWISLLKFEPAVQFSQEDIQLNRKKAVYALANADEQLERTSGLYIDHATGAHCAIGQIGKAFGLSWSDNSEAYYHVSEAIDEDDGGLALIINMNDDLEHDPETGLMMSYVHSWKDIAKMLSDRWGL